MSCDGEDVESSVIVGDGGSRGGEGGRRGGDIGGGSVGVILTSVEGRGSVEGRLTHEAELAVAVRLDWSWRKTVRLRDGR